MNNTNLLTTENFIECQKQMFELDNHIKCLARKQQKYHLDKATEKIKNSVNLNLNDEMVEFLVKSFLISFVNDVFDSLLINDGKFDPTTNE